MRIRTLGLGLALALCLAGTPWLVGCGGGGGGVSPSTAVVDIAYGSRNTDTVLIWYDVANRSSTGIADVVLDNTGSDIDHARSLAIVNDTLFVANQDGHTVTIYRGFGSLVSGQAPDVTLSGLNRPVDLEVAGNDLYVADRDDNAVYIYRDVTTLMTGDFADATLDSANSGMQDPFDLAVANDRLYVASRGNDTVRIFDSASTLTNGAAPIGVLDSATGGISEPMRCAVVGGDLYVSNGYSDYLLIFRNADTVLGGDLPDSVIGPISKVGRPFSPVLAGGRLWVPNRYDWYENNVDYGISIFNHPATVGFGTPPDALLPTPIEEPHNLASVGGLLIGVSNQFGYAFVFRTPSTVTGSTSPDRTFFDPRGDRPVSLAAALR
jgi:hypothetical protein